jgi:VCBS repeat-containing protein
VGLTGLATDADATDTVTYSLTDNAGGRFAIDTNTGVVTVADTSLLDFETATSHTVTVQATSTDGSTSTETFTINLTDDTSEAAVGPVTDSDGTANTISESVADDTSVGLTGLATDADATDTVTYSLTDNAGGRFAIDTNTGVVTVADTSLLDFETATSHTVTVQATSTDGSTSTETFTINLTDDTSEAAVGPVTDSDGTANVISESVANGTSVGLTGLATDADATDTVTYSLTDNAGGRFTIDTNTGVVTVADTRVW